MLENNHINMIFDYMQWILRHRQEEVQTSEFMELISYMNRVERCFKDTLSKPKLQLVIFKQVYNLKDIVHFC